MALGVPHNGSPFLLLLFMWVGSGDEGSATHSMDCRRQTPRKHIEITRGRKGMVQLEEGGALGFLLLRPFYPSFVSPNWPIEAGVGPNLLNWMGWKRWDCHSKECFSYWRKVALLVIFVPFLLSYLLWIHEFMGEIWSHGELGLNVHVLLSFSR